MNQLQQSWEQLTINQPLELAEASNTMHHAAQFLALAAKKYIPAKADDSHTTAVWNPNKGWLIGQEINAPSGNIRLALDYNEFSLVIIDDDLVSYHRKELMGLTKNEVFLWLKLTLTDLGLDTSSFPDKMHYEIPLHPVERGDTYHVDNPGLITELDRYRTNGHILLEHFAKDFKTAQPVLVWPHHFDEGCYIPLQFDGDEVIGSISLGMAVPDVYCNNPYFYVTTWKKDGVDYGSLPDIPVPGKWHTHEWTGQVMETKGLLGLSSTQQMEVSFNFITAAIKNARQLIGWIYKL